MTDQKQLVRDARDVLEVLKAELEFLESGGYGNARSAGWRPQFIFEDSPSCLNYGDSERRQPCSDCILIGLIPPDRRRAKVPCRHILLNQQGETIDSLYRTGTQEELEMAVAQWLKAAIQKLKTERAQG